MNTVMINGNTYIKVQTLINNIAFAHRMIPIMKRAEDLYNTYCTDKVQYKLDFEMKDGTTEEYCLHFNYEKSILVTTAYIGDNGYTFNRDLFRLNFQDIYNSTNIDTRHVSYTPLNNAFTICGDTNYVVNKPFEHNEAWYFQKLTLHDLLPEEVYIAGTELMKELSSFEGNFVYCNFCIDPDEEVLDNITKLLDYTESENA